MDSFEKEAFLNGFKLPAGVDEAGRGPLAGPVVAAAVVLSRPLPVGAGIKDSKTLSPGRRRTLLFDIARAALAIGVGVAWNEEVDSINVHAASLKAMARAVDALGIKPDFLLIDGLYRIDSQIPQRPVVHGDSLSVSIAAASIVAKTVRDSIMDAYHELFPEYNFISNKGYPTKEHLRALGLSGPSPIHRRSFRGVCA